jgi:hypothetical protein
LCRMPLDRSYFIPCSSSHARVPGQ